MTFQKLFQLEDVQRFRKLLLEKQQAELLEKYAQLNQLAHQPNIVFAGDSITEFFPVNELLQTSYKLYNRGIHGINSIQLLNHIDQQIIQLRPEQVFLLIGVNDLKNRTVSEAFETIKKICQTVKQELPSTDIFLMSVFPMNEKIYQPSGPSNRTNDNIKKLNQQLKTLTAIHWLDIHSQLCDCHVQLPADYTTDGLHLTVKGYQVVSRYLQDYLKH